MMGGRQVGVGEELDVLVEWKNGWRGRGFFLPAELDDCNGEPVAPEELACAPSIRAFLVGDATVNAVLHCGAIVDSDAPGIACAVPSFSPASDARRFCEYLETCNNYCE